jgi:hypothetical protein
MLCEAFNQRNSQHCTFLLIGEGAPTVPSSPGPSLTLGIVTCFPVQGNSKVVPTGSRPTAGSCRGPRWKKKVRRPDHDEVTYPIRVRRSQESSSWCDNATYQHPSCIICDNLYAPACNECHPALLHSSAEQASANYRAPRYYLGYAAPMYAFLQFTVRG